MKIGFIIYGSLETLSGGYLYDRLLVNYLRAQGDMVDIISLSWRNYFSHLLDNARFRLPTGYEILVEDELNHPSLLVANKQMHSCPVISLVHHLRSSEMRPGWQNALYGMAEKAYLKMVDGFIFNSLTTQKAVERFLPAKKPAIVAYPPTDRFGAAFPEQEILARASRRPLRILFLGNVVRRKGLHTLLRAVKEQALNVQVDVVGSLNTEPAHARAMQRYASSIGTPVRFHSSLDQQPLIERLSQAHALVVPSSYEGFGIVYLEGMGFGLPAIGTTAGAAGEIIEHGRTGFLIEPEDHRTLAAYISALDQDRALLAKISMRARVRYAQQPAWDRTAKSIREFLQGQVRP